MDFANHGWPAYFAGTIAFQYARYLVLCGGLYLLFWKGFGKWTTGRRVGPEAFRRADLIREARDSFWFCVVTAVPVAFALIPKYRAHTKIYFDIHEHSLYWLPLGFGLLLFGQDAYFYWAHRLLHTRWIYRKIHAVHHLSMNPSPFTAFAMHPVEGLVLFGYIFAFVWIFPTNFYVFVLFQIVSTLLNINGHFGAEFQPEGWKRVPGVRHLNRSTYHTGHHQRYTVNYGLFFTLWDRWMRTFRE